jgi:hypothetical protein
MKNRQQSLLFATPVDERYVVDLSEGCPQGGDVPKSPFVAQGRIAAVGRPDLSGLPSLFGSPLNFIFPRVAFHAPSSF